VKKAKIAAAIAASIASGSAPAALASGWILSDISTRTINGTRSLALTGQLTFSTGPANALQADGMFGASEKTGATPVFTWNFGSDFQISGAGTGSGSFTCTEGIFGSIVGVSVCGNYEFGANGYNESSINPDGTGLVIGGDDFARDLGLAPAQTIDDFMGLLPLIPPTDFSSIIVLENGNTASGMTWTFTANVPVPAAAWLFGSAVALLGWMRRKPTGKGVGFIY
jgi:hypothetical protein